MQTPSVGVGDHTPAWKCPKSQCGVCKVMGDHWARYCPAAVTQAGPLFKTPEKTAKTPETETETAKTETLLAKTPEKTMTVFEQQTQPAETELEIKIESQVVTVKTDWGVGPRPAPDYGRWKTRELSVECTRLGIKSGTASVMIERLTRLWGTLTLRGEAGSTMETTPAKKTKSSLPFL